MEYHLNQPITTEEEKEEESAFNEESKEHSNVQNLEKDDANQERQGLEDEIRANHQEDPSPEQVVFNTDNPYENTTRKNEQFSPVEKEPSGLEFIKRYGPNSRKQSNGTSNPSNAPFGYTMPNRSGTYSSFVGNTEPSHLTASYLRMSRNSPNPGSGGHTESVSSFPVTNYEDSEFMIQAYQRKKKAYEKCKCKLLKAESDLHMEKQRCKMFQEENKRLKTSYRKLDKRYKQQVQANAKQEKEQLRRALELSNKEKEMYKNDRENLKKDNLKLRKAMQDLVNQNFMLKKQINLLEQQEDISNDQNSDKIKEQMDYEIQSLKNDLANESNKNKKWEQFSNELKIGKQKSESENKTIKAELQKMRQQVQELTNKNSYLTNENSQTKSKLLKYQDEVNTLRASQLSQPAPFHHQEAKLINQPVSQEKAPSQDDDYVTTQVDENYKSEPVQVQEELSREVETEISHSIPTVTQQPPALSKPIEKPKPKLAASLFEGENQDFGSSPFNTQQFDAQPIKSDSNEGFIDAPEPRAQKLLSQPGPNIQQNVGIPPSTMQRNSSHNYENPKMNIVSEAEDFFSHLSQTAMEDPPKQVAEPGMGYGTPANFDPIGVQQETYEDNFGFDNPNPIQTKPEPPAPV